MFPKKPPLVAGLSAGSLSKFASLADLDHYIMHLLNSLEAGQPIMISWNLPLKSLPSGPL
jgi:hypothetical protein